MKRPSSSGCPHIGTELPNADFSGLLLKLGGIGTGRRPATPASHACASCAQLLPSIGCASRGCPCCGCNIVLDVGRAELYCSSCRDYVYLQSFDTGLQLAHAVKQYVQRSLAPGLPAHDPGPELRAKRARLAVAAGRRDAADTLPAQACTAAGTLAEVKLERRASNGAAMQAMRDMQRSPELSGHQHHLLQPTGMPSAAGHLHAHAHVKAEPGLAAGEAAEGSPLTAPHDALPPGLRGLNNLGNTCFMNSVLQVFLHSPLMRNFFLGQGHSAAQCSRALAAAAGGAGAHRHDQRPSGAGGGGRPCLSCEMDSIFCAAYSGDRTPFSPTDFLYAWWTFADNLAGYQQQDAHEFYLSILSALTSAVIAPDTPPPAAPAPPQPGGVGVKAEPAAAAATGPSGVGQPVRGTSAPAPAVQAGAKRASDGAGVRGGSMLKQMPLAGVPQQLAHGRLLGDDDDDGDSATLGSLAQKQQRPSSAPGASAPLGADGSRHASPATDRSLRSAEAAAGAVAGGGEEGDDSLAGALTDGAGAVAGQANGGGNAGEGDSAAWGGPVANGADAGGGGGMDLRSLSLVDSVFGGLLRSDVTCAVCGHMSTAYDPFLDISLDLVAHSHHGHGHGHPHALGAGALQHQRPAGPSAVNAAAAGGDDALTVATEGGPSCLNGTMPDVSGTLSRSVSGQVQMPLAMAGIGLPASPSAASGSDDQRAAARPPGDGLRRQAMPGRGGRVTPAGTTTLNSEASFGGLTGGPLVDDGDSGAMGGDAAEGPCGGRPALSQSSGQDGMPSCLAASGGAGGPPVHGRGAGQQQPAAAGACAAAGRGGAAPGRKGGRGRGPGRPPLPTPPKGRSGPAAAAAGHGRGRGAAPPAVPEPASPTVDDDDDVIILEPGTPPEDLQAGLRFQGGPGPGTVPLAVLLAAESAADGGAMDVAGDECITSPMHPAKRDARAGGFGGSVSPGSNGPAAGQVRTGGRAAEPGGAAPSTPSTSPGSGSKQQAPGRGAAGGGGGSPGSAAAGAAGRIVRCGKCATCLQPHLKKGCLRNKPLTGPSLDNPLHPNGSDDETSGASGGPRSSGNRPDADMAPMVTEDGFVDCLTAAAAADTAAAAVATPSQGVVPQQGQPGARPEQMVDAGLAARPHLHPARGQLGSGVAGTGEASLAGCLHAYVSPEHLSAAEACWLCSTCKRRQPAIKQLSIRRLPPVLSIHVKRFEHHHHHHHAHRVSGGGNAGYGGGGGAGGGAGGGRSMPRKLQSRLHFPLVLDMTPFTTGAILRERYQLRSALSTLCANPASPSATAAASTSPRQQQRRTPPPPTFDGDVVGAPQLLPGASSPSGASNGTAAGSPGTAAAGGAADPGPGGSLLYTLFAVISHKGDISGGHYVVFVRCRGHWYQCDDAWVTAASEEEVAAAQGYMLFYASSELTASM